MLTPVELVTEGPNLSFQGSYQLNTWNAAGQLVAMSNEHNSARYTYTPSGLRHSKSVNDRETVHIWDGSAMAAEVTEDDTVWYIRGLGLLWCQDGSGISTYAFNAHGDVVGLIGESGQDYTYDAFGNQLSGGAPIGLMTPQQASADNNPFRYCGEYFDAETGYVYLRARYYDASIGGFVSEDPIRDGMNWYAYCMGNPLMFVDPSGETAILPIIEQAGPYVDKALELLLGVILGALAIDAADTYRQSVNSRSSTISQPISGNPPITAPSKSQSATRPVGELVPDIGIPAPVARGRVDELDKPGSTSVTQSKSDPNARPGQKKQGRERKEKKKKDDKDWNDRSNRRNGPPRPKHHTPGPDHQKYPQKR